MRPDRRELVLDTDEFYILASAEAVVVGPGEAAEMIAYDTSVGSCAPIMQASSIAASASPRRAAPAQSSCSRCAATTCPSYSTMGSASRRSSTNR